MAGKLPTEIFLTRRILEESFHLKKTPLIEANGKKEILDHQHISKTTTL